MTFQELVSPDKIESRLQEIWEELAKKNTTRACLFNLMVYTQFHSRSEYYRKIVQKLVEQFPCRIIFITSNPSPSSSYLKTTISVIFLEDKGCQAACDQIDIEVAGEESNKIPLLILPHLLPDLPVHLLWGENPTLENPLFEKLATFADRIIFDSEVSHPFSSFIAFVDSYFKKIKACFSDLNWVRTESWRDMLASHFYPQERMAHLKQLKKAHLCFNAEKSTYFSQVQIQALYLQAWISSRLGFSLKEAFPQKQELSLQYSPQAQWILSPKSDPRLTPGSILSLEIVTEKAYYSFQRKEENPDYVMIQESTEKACQLPYSYQLEKESLGLSLTKEILSRGTSLHYQQTTHLLLPLKEKNL